MSIITIINVVRRNRIRLRSLRYLQNVSESTIEDLMINIGEKQKKHVVDTLQFMVLELGYPIHLDLSRNFVKKTADLSAFIPYTQQPQTRVYRQAPVQQVVHTPRAQETQSSTPVTPTPKKEKSLKVDFHCTGCGTGLPAGTGYCYNCGQRQ